MWCKHLTSLFIRTPISLLFYFLFSGSCVPLSSQTLKCGYLYEYTKQEGRNLFLKDYCLCIEVDGEYFTCYSENQYLRDSIGMAVLTETNSIYEAQEQQNRYPRGENWIIFGQPAIGTFREIQSFAYLYLEGIGEYVQPNWEISTKTEEICGYTCQTATADYLGRKWTIWYTEEIPVNLGPWLLWGAPGLILKAEDDQGLFRFTCETIMQTQTGRRMALERKLTEAKLNPITKYYTYCLDEMEPLWTKMTRNLTVADEMMGGHTVIYDSTGKPKDVKNFPYIPLIPDEYWENL